MVRELRPDLKGASPTQCVSDKPPSRLTILRCPRKEGLLYRAFRCQVLARRRHCGYSSFSNSRHGLSHEAPGRRVYRMITMLSPCSFCNPGDRYRGMDL